MIGVSVKNSTSDLLIANCDEFIFYDDLVREKRKPAARKAAAKTSAAGAPKASAKAVASEAETATKKSDSERSQEALDLIVETVDALVAERGAEDKIWGSMVKQALKRRKPGFNESYYGFRSFNAMLEEAQRNGALTLERDEKSGGYIIRSSAQEE